MSFNETGFSIYKLCQRGVKILKLYFRLFFRRKNVRCRQKGCNKNDNVVEGPQVCDNLCIFVLICPNLHLCFRLCLF